MNIFLKGDEMAKQKQKMTRPERCAHRKANNERRRQERREEAEERQATRDKRSNKQQIAWLDERGFAATRERERLLLQ